MFSEVRRILEPLRARRKKDRKQTDKSRTEPAKELIKMISKTLAGEVGGRKLKSWE